MIVNMKLQKIQITAVKTGNERFSSEMQEKFNFSRQTMQQLWSVRPWYVSGRKKKNSSRAQVVFLNGCTEKERYGDQFERTQLSRELNQPRSTCM